MTAHVLRFVFAERSAACTCTSFRSDMPLTGSTVELVEQLGRIIVGWERHAGRLVSRVEVV